MRGKAPAHTAVAVAPRDHPRLCGEKENGKTRRKNLRGSPPPMRGKGLYRFNDVIPDRITPAYAGKSAGNIDLASASEDHPRLCGEKTLKYSKPSLFAGSPPPMRGKATGKEV